jgi:NAD(P)-dependent dehydrogenase (short-subunit alcohol dehydrogenase family)
VLKLLRCGATVIATTRFPADAAKRFAAEKDAANFKGRIHIYGLDFRHIPNVEAFCAFLGTRYASLDGIVNNACQTIRRPTTFYQHLMDGERTAQALLSGCGGRSSTDDSTTAAETGGSNEVAPEVVELLSREADRQREAASRSNHMPRAAVRAPSTASGGSGGGGDGSLERVVGSGDGSGGGASASAAGFELSQVPVHRDDGATADDAALFPTGAVDVNGQQVDLRTKTSWLLKLDEVETPEVCEVLAVNTVAPFILNSRLKPLLLKSVHPDRCVGGSRLSFC